MNLIPNPRQLDISAFHLNPVQYHIFILQKTPHPQAILPTSGSHKLSVTSSVFSEVRLGTDGWGGQKP